jgi:hypothetical protein
MTLNASELSRLGSSVWSDSRDVVGREAGSWLRARRSRGGEEDEADRGAEGEDETSVAVLSRGTELGWGTSTVDDPEEGPTEAGLGGLVTLGVESPSFALPFWSVRVAFDGCGVGVDGIRARDGPLSCGSSCSRGSCDILVGSLAFRRRRSKVHRLCAFRTLSGSSWLDGVRCGFKQLRMGERRVPRKDRRRLRLAGRED